MKKIISTIIAVLMLFSLVSCGAQQEPEWEQLTVENVNIDINPNWKYRDEEKHDYYYLDDDNFLMISKVTQIDKNDTIDDFMKGVINSLESSEIEFQDYILNDNNLQYYNFKISTELSNTPCVLNGAVFIDGNDLYSFSFLIKDKGNYDEEIEHVWNSLKFTDGHSNYKIEDESGEEQPVKKRPPNRPAKKYSSPYIEKIKESKEKNSGDIIYNVTISSSFDWDERLFSEQGELGEIVVKECKTKAGSKDFHIIAKLANGNMAFNYSSKDPLKINLWVNGKRKDNYNIIK